MHVIIVGGGIVGLASAYYLAQGGVDVTVCEQSDIGTIGATELSAGGIRSQFSTPTNVRLSLRSIEVWEQFEERFGVDIAYERIGYLFLAREESTAEQFRSTVAMQNELGVQSEFLTPAEAAEHCPELETEQFVGATYCAQDGIVDPHLALQGFASTVRELDVTVRVGTEVTDVLREGEDDVRVTGVETESGRLYGDYVVNATGPWAGEIAAMAGVQLPISLNRHQIAIVVPTIHLSDEVPLVVDMGSGTYFRPEREGAALVGGYMSEFDTEQDPDSYSESIDLDWAAEVLENASDVARYFDGASQVKNGWAGLTTHTPDDNPIIEETVPGFINAIAFAGHGFQHAPAVGMVVTEIIEDGCASLVDVDRFGSDRFDDVDGQDVGEQNVI